MSSSTSPTVAQIIAGLGLTTLTGEIVIDGPSALSTTVNVAAPLANLLVLDTGATGATMATATLTTQMSPLVVAAGVQGSETTSNGGKTVTFSGTVDQIGADLKLLSYVSVAAGNDNINLTFTDSGGNTKDASFAVSVLPSPNDPGTPTSAPYVQTTAQGQNATLSGNNQIYVADDKIDAVFATGTTTSVAGGGTGSVLTFVQNGGSYDYSNMAGAATVVANDAPGTITGGAAGSSLVAFLPDQPTVYIGGMGNDELIGGKGNMTVNGGDGGSLTVFGGTGLLDFVGGHNDHETVVGGIGAETIHAAASGGDYFGGSGGSQMFATGPGSFLIGDVSGDVLTASAYGGDGLVAGAGNETLNGAGSLYENVLFGGTGADTVMLGHGADTFVGGAGTVTIAMGSGSAAIFAGTGAMLLQFDASTMASTSRAALDYVGGFKVGLDHLRLSGGIGVASATAAGGSTALALTDGTHIVLAGVTAVPQAGLFG